MIHGSDHDIKGTGLQSALYFPKDRRGSHDSLIFSWDICRETIHECRKTDAGGFGRDTDTANGSAAHGGRLFPVAAVQQTAAGGDVSI